MRRIDTRGSYEVERCEWGQCDAAAVEQVEYPDGTALACCAECAAVAREEVADAPAHDQD